MRTILRAPGVTLNPLIIKGCRDLLQEVFGINPTKKHFFYSLILLWCLHNIMGAIYMPSFSGQLPLNNELFFKYFVCNAFSKASKELLNVKDRLRARVAAIAFGIFTLGIGTVICKCYYYDRRTISPTNLQKMQKKHLIKKFSGLDENKIKVINSLYDHSANFSALKFKQQYDVLSHVAAEEKFGDFCIRNKAQIRSFLLPYICAFEVLAQLKSEAIHRQEEIQKLETHLLRRRHIHPYHECLLDTLCKDPFKKQLAEKILYSKETREDLLETLYSRGLNFQKFKSIYSHVKSISNQTGIPNSLLSKEGNKKMRILAFACELLPNLESPDNLDPYIDLAGKELGPLSYNEQEYLRQCLASSLPSQKINKVITALTPKKKEPLKKVALEIQNETPSTPSVQTANESVQSDFLTKIINFFSPQKV